MEERRGGIRDRRGGGYGQKPVEVGQEMDVEIQELSRRGEGIARVQGFVIFVAGAKQGEHVKIKVNRVSRRFAEAQVLAKAGEAAQSASDTGTTETEG